MKNENDDHNRLPAAALQAFENYPQIKASPDFNRRVLERVLVEPTPSRLELFCDRLDEIFARPVLKLFGVASLGGVLALLGTSALLAACGLSTPASQHESNPTMAAREPETLLAGSLYLQNRLAFSRAGEIPFPLDDEYFAPRVDEFETPARREKSVIEDANNRSSSCPVAFHSLV